MRIIDWYEWHKVYDKPDLALRMRLHALERLISYSLRSAGAGARLISICAGQAQELMNVFQHEALRDTEVHLIETDVRNLRVAQQLCKDLKLKHTFTHGFDAGLFNYYKSIAPADCIVLSGVFSNITTRDTRATISALRYLCKTNSSVVWTRHCQPVQLLPRIEAWFTQAGFALSETEMIEGVSVSRHIYLGDTVSFVDTPSRIFTFRGGGRLEASALDACLPCQLDRRLC